MYRRHASWRTGAFVGALGAVVLFGRVLPAQTATSAPTTRPASQPAAHAEAPVGATMATTPSGQPPGAPTDSTESATAPETPADVSPQVAAREQMTSGLIGSKHDFTRSQEHGRDLCLPCHTPHLVSAPTPLLDRRTPTTQPLRPYEAPGMELTGWSLLCLGCHDGVTANDVFTSAHALSFDRQLSGRLAGVGGARSHPVGVAYPTSRADYEPVAAVEASGLLLPDGRIQCTTCHDAHNTNRHAGMLKISNQRSQLCLTCHRL